MGKIFDIIAGLLVEVLPVFIARFLPIAQDYILEKVAKSSNKIDDALVEAIKEAVKK